MRGNGMLYMAKSSFIRAGSQYIMAKTDETKNSRSGKLRQR